LQGKAIKRLIFATVLLASPAVLPVSPASAQTRLAPKNATAKTDKCAPFGRLANGTLVYPVNCDNVPAPQTPPPQAQARQAQAPQAQAPQAPIPAAAPAPEAQEEAHSTGLFGLSYERKRPDQ
jgi:hypothetical protein